MNSEDLLELLGQLAREEEERFEARWAEIASGALPEREWMELGRGAFASRDAALVKQLTRPLTPEERERLWKRIEAMLRDAPERP